VGLWFYFWPPFLKLNMKEEINYPMELIMSDKLRKVLEDSNSKVAKQILELKTLENCKEWINYLDVAKDDATKISYLNKSRYATLSSKNIVEFEDLKEGDEFTCIDSNKVHDVEDFGLNSVYGEKFTVASKPTLNFGTLILQAKNQHNSFWNFRKWDIDICTLSMWDKDMRYMATCGKVVQKLLGPQDGKELAKFCELFGAYHPDFRFNVDYDVEFVKGDWIKHWYYEDNYHNNSGSLGGSCMRYNSCQRYFDLYTTNENVQLFVVKDKESEKLVSRCLIWDGKYFDRIYAIDTKLEEKVKAYLLTIGLTDAYQSEETITIDIENGTNHIDRFPYCDTFKFISEDYITNNEDEYHVYCLNSTDGYWEGYDDDCVTCAISGERINSDDAVWIEGMGDVHRDHVCYSRYDDCYYLSDDVVYCECMDDYIHDSSVTKLYDGEYTHDDRAVLLCDGNYADEDDDDLVELEDGEHALKDDCEYSELNNEHILSSKAHYCDVQEDWVYEHQLKKEDEEELIES
jgi:hypothetical protein